MVPPERLGVNRRSRIAQVDPVSRTALAAVDAVAVHQDRIDRILRRGLLVAVCVGASQALVFAVGWWFVYEETHQNVAESVEDVILQSNVAAAEAILRVLDGIPNVDVPGSREWERTQKVIEGLELGGGGFACVLDSRGNIACHPDLLAMPGLRDVNLSNEELFDLHGNVVGRMSEVEPGETFKGIVEFVFDGRHYLATRVDADTRSQLLVHQPVSGLSAASAHVTGPLLVRSATVGLLVVALTGCLALVLVRAHDRSMARWTRDLERLVEERSVDVVQSHRAVVMGIAKLAEYRDNETGLHVERMCAFSAMLAREYARQFGGLDDAWIDDLELAASLHDIGKVAIPDSILLKPGKLTDAEFEQMKVHAETGAEALCAVREELVETRLVDLGREICSGHHEKWNGRGYPRGLSGVDIPLSARLVSLADVFDALMSKRVYKDAMPFDKVVAIIREGAGQHFDPDVVACFEEIKTELAATHARLLDVEEPPAALPVRATAPHAPSPDGIASSS